MAHHRPAGAARLPPRRPAGRPGCVRLDGDAGRARRRDRGHYAGGLQDEGAARRSGRALQCNRGRHADARLARALRGRPHPERTLTMRRLVMWNLQTLDGYFEGKAPWDLEFHEAAWGDELQQFSLEQAEEVGTLLFGRATYEGMASYWTAATGPTADFMNDVPKLVFSRTLDAATWKNTRLVRGDEVAELKRGEGKDLFVFGNAKLSDSLLRRGLFDELRICVAPVVLGTGVPLFKPGSPRQNLTLQQARPLSTGGVILRYAAKPRDA